jgi:hypothetical protein
MKKLLLLLFISSTVCFSQKKLKQADSISYKQLETIKGFKNIVEVQYYQAVDNNWLTVGDTLIVGRPSNPNKIESGSDMIGGSSINNHTYIILGTGGAALMGVMFMGNEGMIGDKMVITRIRIGRISKKQPYATSFEFNKAGGGRFLASKKIARADIDKALSSGEIINPKAPMTRSQAIAKLKEAKELFDIEMMSREEFDALKKELSPIIRGKN